MLTIFIFIKYSSDVYNHHGNCFFLLLFPLFLFLRSASVISLILHVVPIGNAFTLVMANILLRSTPQCYHIFATGAQTQHTITCRLLATKYNDLDEKSKKLYDRIIRIDHAGEFGADRIYAGQMAVLGKTDVGPLIQHMWDQEKHHLATFERLIPEYRVRPTAFLPLWNIAGYVLGAGTALLGKEAAMACTVAVEETITDHYNAQLRELLELEGGNSDKHKELMDIIHKFRDEEMEHHDTGLANDAELAPAYTILKNVIQAGCYGAIKISEAV